jgi:hypothetical protein
MVISVIKLTRKLLNNLTIHKLDKLRQFSSVGFVVALKLSPFIGAHFKTWHTKTFLWLTAMGVRGVVVVTSEVCLLLMSRKRLVMPPFSLWVSS